MERERVIERDRDDASVKVCFALDRVAYCCLPRDSGERERERGRQRGRERGREHFAGMLLFFVYKQKSKFLYVE